MTKTLYLCLQTFPLSKGHVFNYEKDVKPYYDIYHYPAPPVELWLLNGHQDVLTDGRTIEEDSWFRRVLISGVGNNRYSLGVINKWSCEHLLLENIQQDGIFVLEVGDYPEFPISWGEKYGNNPIPLLDLRATQFNYNHIKASWFHKFCEVMEMSLDSLEPEELVVYYLNKEARKQYKNHLIWLGCTEEEAEKEIQECY